MFNLFSSIAFAENSSTKVPSGFESMVENALPLAFMFGIMYLLVIRPQAKKAKEQAELLKNLKPGDEIVTSGGIIGRVKSVAEDFVSIESGGAQLKIKKDNVSAASSVQKKRGEKAVKATPAGVK